MHKTTVMVIIAALTTGCAAQSGVVDMGGGRYFVSRQAATGFPGMGNLRAEALQEAAAACRAQSKAVAIVDEHQTQPPYLLGNYPRIDPDLCIKVSNATPISRNGWPWFAPWQRYAPSPRLRQSGKN